MQISISATILHRFIKFSHIKIEIKNGQSYLIGSNDTVAAVQYLGGTDQNDDCCYVNKSEEFSQAVNSELIMDGLLTFETVPELAIGSVTGLNCGTLENVIVWPDESPLDKWRDWFKISDESAGFMYCDLSQLITLWDSSPSCEIVFPEVINAFEPVIVRDVNDDKWAGVFIPAIDNKKIIKPATLPEWMCNA